MIASRSLAKLSAPVIQRAAFEAQDPDTPAGRQLEEIHAIPNGIPRTTGFNNHAWESWIDRWLGFGFGVAVYTSAPQILLRTLSRSLSFQQRQWRRSAILPNSRCTQLPRALGNSSSQGANIYNMIWTVTASPAPGIDPTKPQPPHRLDEPLQTSFVLASNAQGGSRVSTTA